MQFLWMKATWKVSVRRRTRTKKCLSVISFPAVLARCYGTNSKVETAAAFRISSLQIKPINRLATSKWLIKNLAFTTTTAWKSTSMSVKKLTSGADAPL